MLELAATPAFAPAPHAQHRAAVLRLLPPRALVRLQLSPRSGGTDSICILGTSLPLECGRSLGADPLACWLAPCSWLLISPSINAAALRDAARAACSGRLCAAVELSDSLIGLELAGPAARTLLARGCALDLDPRGFGPGQCTRVRWAQLAVLLRSISTERYELLVERGAAWWLWEWLREAIERLD
jgi:sarcosine oxidase, subunit gamma